MKINSVLSAIVALIGLGIAASAMVIEPSGEIDASVITTLSICLVYSAALLGIELATPERLLSRMNKHKQKRHVTDIAKK